MASLSHSHETEFVVLGTGLAPLVVARKLMEQGRDVLVVNPERDFFLEDSEFPIDPVLAPDSRRIDDAWFARHDPEKVFRRLSSIFPGPLDMVDLEHRDHAPGTRGESFQIRGQLWVEPRPSQTLGELATHWNDIENFYVKALGAKRSVREVDGAAVGFRFPGANRERFQSTQRALWVAGACELAVDSFRAAMLDFVRERLGPDRLVFQPSQVAFEGDSFRLRREGRVERWRVREGMLVFWTPRLTHWLEELEWDRWLKAPALLRLWEEWVLNSRDPIGPMTIGCFDNCLVWGEPDPPNALSGGRLHVLRRGETAPFGWGARPARPRVQAASLHAFEDLSVLCHDFLEWQSFTVAALRPRVIFEAGKSGGPAFAELKAAGVTLTVATDAAGGVAEVCENALTHAERMLGQGDDA